MSPERKSECRTCGGELKQVGKLPTRPGYEVQMFECMECGVESRVEVDTRFG